MTHNASIIVLDNMLATKMRIKYMMDKQTINVLEAATPFEFFAMFADNIRSIKLIILNVNLGSIEELEILRRVKTQNAIIPVVILTTNGERNIFAKGIVEGAADYILKPFDDDFLESRLNKLLNQDVEGNDEDLSTHNHYHFVNTEIKKAKKGNYIFSMVLCTFFTPLTQSSTVIDEKYSKLSELIYKRLKSLFWDTDRFDKYDAQSFLGFFPFCAEANTTLIHEKLQVKFKEFRESNTDYKTLCLANTFVTFPQDGMNAADLINKMVTNTNLKIIVIKEELQKNKNSEDTPKIHL